MKACPICAHTRIETTTVGYSGPLDLNKARCHGCDWTGQAWEAEVLDVGQLLAFDHHARAAAANASASDNARVMASVMVRLIADLRRTRVRLIETELEAQERDYDE